MDNDYGRRFAEGYARFTLAHFQLNNAIGKLFGDQWAEASLLGSAFYEMYDAMWDMLYQLMVYNENIDMSIVADRFYEEFQDKAYELCYEYKDSPVCVIKEAKGFSYLDTEVPVELVDKIYDALVQFQNQLANNNMEGNDNVCH